MIQCVIRGKQGRHFVAAAVMALGIAGLSPARSMAQNDKPSKIVFVSNRAGAHKFHIFTANPDGTQQTDLTQGAAIEFDPALSPDGKQIAFGVVTVKDKKSDIYVMNADGSQRTRLTQNDANTFASAPTWSPDGKRIAFSTLQILGPTPPKFTIQGMDADGKNRKQIGEGMMPAWSPDGKRIFYSVLTSTHSVPTLNVMDIDGGNAKVLADKGIIGTWSPDGKQIAFTSGVSGADDKPEIFIMNSDGSGKTQLTKSPDQASLGPQWSADGKHILFTRGGKETIAKKTQICAMDADGSNIKVLIDDGSINYTGDLGLFFVIGDVMSSQ